MRRQRLPLASELGQGKLEAVPAEGTPYVLVRRIQEASPRDKQSPLGRPTTLST